MSTWAANINRFDTQALVLNTKPNTSLIGGKTLSKEEAQEAAQDFEAFFMTKMMESIKIALQSYVPDGSGVWYRDRIAQPYGEVNNDDGLLLYMSKDL